MSKYQHLLLIINPALRHPVPITHAAALAKVSGASLHIAALAEPLEIMSLVEKRAGEAAREAYLKKYRKWLTKQEQNLDVLGLKYTTEVVWADNMKLDILEYVAELQPDLLIKEVQFEPAIKRAFFTPLDLRLLRCCPIPVYLVGLGQHTLPRKIVAAVDASDSEPANSERNHRIIQQASTLAMHCDAELHLVYACDISAIYLSDMGGLTISDINHELQTAEKKRFLELAVSHSLPSIRQHFIIGHPASALCDFVSEHKVDVIVMGRVRHHGLKKLLGSTTEHILYQVPCSVLAI